jgi:hypothetical protein
VTARLFLVTSPGYTATKWLAWALDLDPRVACSHSAGLPPEPRSYTASELKQLVRDKFTARDDLSLDAWFAPLVTEADAQGLSAMGNVHRYNLTALRRNQGRFEGKRDFAAMNVVRHPVPWLESGARQLGRMHGVSSLIRRRLRRCVERDRPRLRRLGVPTFPWPSELGFLYLCSRLERLVEEVQDASILHRRYEDLTADREILAQDFERLTDLPHDPAWLERVAEQRVHAHRALPISPAEQLAVWPLWKRAVFADAASRAGLLEAYAPFDYGLSLPASPSRVAVVARSPVSRRASTPSASRRLEPKAWRSEHLPWMPARALRWHRFVEPRLARVLDEVRRGWSQAGIALPDLAADPDAAPMSPGLDGGVRPQVSASAERDAWHLTGVHPWGHDRSAALVAHHPGSGRRAALSYKGSGIRSLAGSFVVRGDRCAGYQATLKRDLHKPIDVLSDRPAGEWLSHELIGGAHLRSTWFEARQALGWHALLLAHDGEPAATCVPGRMWRPREFEVRIGTRVRRVSLVELLTDPELVTPEQFAQVAEDAGLGWLPERVRSRLRPFVGALYVSLKQPVVYEHATRAKLRIGHVYEQLLSDDDMTARAAERGTSVATVVLDWLCEIHAASPAFCPVEPGELDTVARRFDYLRRSHQQNHGLDDALLADTGARAGRTLGALHGAGGHLLGRRIVVGAAGEVDAWGLARRMGAPGGGSTAPRNVTVAGELVDTVHLYNPRHDVLCRLATRISLARPSWLSWAHPDSVERFQHIDVEQAEVAMAMLDAILTGGELPEAIAELSDLRVRRKRLEDELRRASPVGASANVIRAIADLERRAKKRRRRRPELPQGTALDAFRGAYEYHRRQALERS